MGKEIAVRGNAHEELPSMRFYQWLSTSLSIRVRSIRVRVNCCLRRGGAQESGTGEASPGKGRCKVDDMCTTVLIVSSSAP